MPSIWLTDWLSAATVAVLGHAAISAVYIPVYVLGIVQALYEIEIMLGETHCHHILTSYHIGRVTAV